MASLLDSSIGVIGSGNMATALIRGWISAGLLNPTQITTYDVDGTKARALAVDSGIGVAQNCQDMVTSNRIIVVATKPPVVARALSELKLFFTPDHTVISIAAGVKIATIESVLPAGIPVVRVMPNTPCLVGAGASVYSLGSAASETHGSIAQSLLESVGIAINLPEQLLDAVTGLSGSGPAYVFMMIEALADGGVLAGLDRASSLKLAAQTVMGSARMVMETGDHPGELKDRVCSPAGTTIAGVAILENRGLRGALMEAVKAGANRSIELSKQS